ncbi:MAG: hypothetical protein LBJ18_03670 [Rickettsiales bacterium]|jgi:hypothetical protein|nr:hypothetical protein [Rickettsiales bacterium]
MIEKKLFLNQPAANDILVAISGASQFTDMSRVFAPGIYEMSIGGGSGQNVNGTSFVQQFSVSDYFYFNAYCGSNNTDPRIGGTNPYAGQFKANSVLRYSGVFGGNGESDGIFGGAGGIGEDQGKQLGGGGGNALGNAYSIGGYNAADGSGGAGSAAHCMPLTKSDGVSLPEFGVDYLRCFHCGGAGGRGNSWSYGGGGGAYGNGAQGNGANGLSYIGGIGTGGTEIGAASGVSAGKAWFDGASWIDLGVGNSSAAPVQTIKLKFISSVV